MLTYSYSLIVWDGVNLKVQILPLHYNIALIIVI